MERPPSRISRPPRGHRRHVYDRERRRQAQVDASKLPIKLAFPLVACVLPSFVALTIVPILIGALSSLTLGPLAG